MKTYNDLLVWQKAIHFVTQVYTLVKEFPQEEKLTESNHL